MKRAGTRIVPIVLISIVALWFVSSLNRSDSPSRKALSSDAVTQPDGATESGKAANARQPIPAPVVAEQPQIIVNAPASGTKISTAINAKAKAMPKIQVSGVAARKEATSSVNQGALPQPAIEVKRPAPAEQRSDSNNGNQKKP